MINTEHRCDRVRSLMMVVYVVAVRVLLVCDAQNDTMH